MITRSVVNVLAVVPEEPQSGHNLDLSAEVYDHQRLIEEPIPDDGLTQDIDDMIGNNDVVDNGEAVPVEDGKLTPTYQRLIKEPIPEDGLTQDIDDMIDNNDVVDNREAVLVEDGTLTPTLGGNIDRFTA